MINNFLLNVFKVWKAVLLLFTTIIVEVRPSKFNVSFTDQYFADSQSKTEIENYHKFLSWAGDFRLYERCSLSVPLKCLIQSQTSLKKFHFLNFSLFIDGRRNIWPFLYVKGSSREPNWHDTVSTQWKLYHFRRRRKNKMIPRRNLHVTLELVYITLLQLSNIISTWKYK